jgi:hypothetical protein
MGTKSQHYLPHVQLGLTRNSFSTSLNMTQAITIEKSSMDASACQFVASPPTLGGR